MVPCTFVEGFDQNRLHPLEPTTSPSGPVGCLLCCRDIVSVISMSESVRECHHLIAPRAPRRPWTSLSTFVRSVISKRASIAVR